MAFGDLLGLPLGVAHEYTALILAESARLLQSSLELAARTMQPHLDIRRGQTKQRCDLVRRQAIDIVQQEHGLVTIREFGDMRLDASTHLVLLDYGESGRPAIVREREFLKGRVAVFLGRMSPLSNAVNRDVCRDLIEPSLQRILIAEGIQTGVCAQKCFLCQVFGVRVIADERTDVARHRRTVPFNLADEFGQASWHRNNSTAVLES